AILHGIMHKEGEGEIEVSIVDCDKHLEIDVKDNGVGRKAAALLNLDKNRPHNSFGIEVTQARLAALKPDAETASGIVIEDIEENGRAAGTLVKIFIPQ
ncbi:MAG: hypothetical protein ACTHM5_00365, partial [Ginsengibacter sp.]